MTPTNSLFISKYSQYDHQGTRKCSRGRQDPAQKSTSDGNHDDRFARRYHIVRVLGGLVHKRKFQDCTLYFSHHAFKSTISVDSNCFKVFPHLSRRYDWNKSPYSTYFDKSIPCGGCESCDPEYAEEDSDDEYWNQFENET